MMLASTPNLLQMCSFDATKSTKGASKLRRDLINSEIANLRDLLPLPSSTRQRLSQLQLMALVCVYVRKANYFQYAFRKHELIGHHGHHAHHGHHHPHYQLPVTNFGFSKALSGFLMMMTQNGKLLYISDNAAEYLGHSMEDLLIHGDSVYDIIEKQDHQTIQNELMRSTNQMNVPDTRIFLCRMNVSRNSRRQMRFGDQKVVLVQGHFVSYLPLCSRNEPVFLATCTPVAMPETRECVVQGSTNVFTSIHSMDMKFIHLDTNGEFHLGYSKNQLKNLSWYDIVHWDHLKEAQSKHRLIIQSEQERSCILLLRLQTSAMQWIWVHSVLQVKDNNENSQQPVIVCTNQVLSEKEAAVMQANSWLYQFYSLHSKMHYMQNPTPATPTSLTVSGNLSASSSPAPSVTSTNTAPASTNNSSTSSNYATSESQTTSTSYSSNYTANGSTSNSCTATAAVTVGSSYHASEAPSSLALHPFQPTNMSTYYSPSNGMSVSTGATNLHSHYGQYSSTMSHQQYSPQAGTLPYQTPPPTTTSTTTTTTPNTPPATATTETNHRVKSESEHDQTSQPTTTRAKRNRNSNHDGNEPVKRNKKKSTNNQQQSSNIRTTTTSTMTTSHLHEQLSNNHNHSYGSYRNSSSTMANNTSSTYNSYHHSGSMFGSSAHTDLSPMITSPAAAAAAYYGGSPYHHHQMSAYPSHHHHHHHHFSHHHQNGTQTSKTSSFSFFDHETAGTTTVNNQNHHLSNNNLSSGSNNNSQQQQQHRSPHHQHSHLNETLPNSSSSSSMVSSSAFTSTANHLDKQSRIYPRNDLLNNNSNDRRDLDKVRSPESITSTTSDYGSMTSQSPPSSFEKLTPSAPFSTVSQTIQHDTTSSFDAYNSSSYHHAHQKNSVWPSASEPLASTASTTDSTFHTTFPRLSSFQFWPSAAGYTATNSGNCNEYSGTQYHHHHTHHSAHHHDRHPHLASTFPMDSLLHPGHHQTTTSTTYGHPMATGHHLFAPYGQDSTSTTTMVMGGGYHSHHHPHIETEATAKQIISATSLVNTNSTTTTAATTNNANSNNTSNKARTSTTPTKNETTNTASKLDSSANSTSTTKAATRAL